MKSLNKHCKVVQVQDAQARLVVRHVLLIAGILPTIQAVAVRARLAVRIAIEDVRKLALMSARLKLLSHAPVAVHNAVEDVVEVANLIVQEVVEWDVRKHVVAVAHRIVMAGAVIIVQATHTTTLLIVQYAFLPVAHIVPTHALISVIVLVKTMEGKDDDRHKHKGK